MGERGLGHACGKPYPLITTSRRNFCLLKCLATTGGFNAETMAVTGRASDTCQHLPEIFVTPAATSLGMCY